MRFSVAEFIKKYPALSLFLVAVAFGSALVAPVLAGWLSPQFLQLGALSASAAGFVLAAAEGGRVCLPRPRALLSIDLNLCQRGWQCSPRGRLSRGWQRLGRLRRD